MEKKFLDREGLAYFWEKIKGIVGSTTDNNYSNEDKEKVDAIEMTGTGDKFLADDGTYKTAGLIDDVKVNGESVVTDKVANIDLSSFAKEDTVNTLDARVETLENLGSYVGAFDTLADLPLNKSDIDSVTVNDFATVRADSNHLDAPARYIVKSINATTGALTWSYDFTYSTDISGKMDLVNGAVEENLASYDSKGQVKDSGKKLSDLVLEADLVAITEAEIDTITEE